jgi:hypothetical protein
VEDALADAQLHGALDRATAKFTSQRRTGLASLPDADAVRDRARELDEEKKAMADFGSSDSGASLGDILGAALSRAQKKDDDEEK